MLELLRNVDGTLLVSLVIILLFLLFVLYLASRNQLGILKHTAYTLVCEAEEDPKFGRGTGDRKYALVADLIYLRIPVPLRIFISPKIVGELIDAAVLLMKERMKPT